MYDKTLPIGSIVILENAVKRVMILGYCQYKAGEMTKIYDYVGCPFPEGFISSDKMVLFDHAQIKHIFALGYQNEEQFIFREKLKVALEKNEEIIKQTAGK
ncbi:MAG: DUF4176 domain-containing protein [Lachnospiraceae bacterium]|nr:DUF4176 domain-containing protein [Lachnospiraceae bacterium]